MFLNFLKKHKYTIILVLVILIVVGYGAVKWYEGRMFWVRQGLADPKFPFHEYSTLELLRITPGGDLNEEQRKEFFEELKNLPTRTTPLETFDTYIQALKDGDIERAAECLEKDIEREEREEYIQEGMWPIVWKVPDEYKEFLYNLQKEGKLEKRAMDLEEIRAKIIYDIGKIKRGSIGEFEVRYGYRCWIPENEPCYLFFAKDLWGDWKLAGPRLF